MTPVFVVIEAVKGSAPRDAGTAMKVMAAGIEGTIGGGALELAAIEHARSLLTGDGGDTVRTFPLGPALGQCCGGAVTLRFTTTPHPLDPEIAPRTSGSPAPGRQSLWLWGAGHVGRAVVALAPPAAFDITWMDSAEERFPPTRPAHVTVLPAADMALLAARAPADAHHLIFTYSHDIDFALCAALLRRGAPSIGLIGSATKRARFFKRLRAAGLDPTPINCPIGDKTRGKAPAQIAEGIIATFLRKDQAA